MADQDQDASQPLQESHAKEITYLSDIHLSLPSAETTVKETFTLDSQASKQTSQDEEHHMTRSTNQTSDRPVEASNVSPSDTRPHRQLGPSSDAVKTLGPTRTKDLEENIREVGKLVGQIQENLQAEAAALQAKCQMMEKLQETQRREAELRHQMELQKRTIKLEEVQRGMEETERLQKIRLEDFRREMEETERLQKIKQEEAQREMEEARRFQELENQMIQVKLEEDRARLQMELNVANAVEDALNPAAPKDEANSLLNSLPRCDPINELFLSRTENQGITDRVNPTTRPHKGTASQTNYAQPSMSDNLGTDANLSNMFHHIPRNTDPRFDQVHKDHTRVPATFHNSNGLRRDTPMNTQVNFKSDLSQWPHSSQGQPQAGQGLPIQSEHSLNASAPPFTSRYPAFSAQTNTDSLHEQRHCIYPQEDAVPTTYVNLAKSIADALTISRLPVPKPPVFRGDPLEYPSWFAAFQHMVRNSAVGPEDKMLMLREFIEGPAKVAVGDLYYDLGEESYNSALKILKGRFGEDYTIAEALKERLEAWPEVKDKDTVSLRNYVDFLRQCCVMAKKITGLSILEDPAQIKRLAHKLPDSLALSWGQRVADSKLSCGRYPSFATFVKFLDSKCEALHEADLHNKGRKRGADQSQSTKAKGKQTYTTISEVDKPEQENKPGEDTAKDPATNTFPAQRGCLYCNDKHFTPDCKKLAEKPYAERKEFAIKRKLCFKCLRGFHAAKGCFAKVSCDTCKMKHVTIMHDPDFNPTQKATHQVSLIDEETDMKFVGTTKCGECLFDEVKKSYAVDHHITTRLYSLYMPVYVSSGLDPSKEILVYAMLDTMSDTTFLSDSVMNRLNLGAQDSVLTLTTMTSKAETVECKSFSNLRVRAYDSEETLKVPKAYSHPEISVDRSQIPTRDTILSMSHLEHIAHCFPPLLDAPIAILLGVNVSEALRPLEVVFGEPGQPYAQRTRLGWGLVGEVAASCEQDGPPANAFASKTLEQPRPPTRKSAFCFRTRDRTNEHLIRLLETDFTCPDDPPSSQEDRKFMNILSEGIELNSEGHYQMPLPFKDGEPLLPPNRHLALRRLYSLKRRFLSSPEHFQLYGEFMSQMVERRDAEIVPEAEISSSPTWYIPHHGVYNPNKPGKIRVVFDCAAKCNDVSLNDFLLCGPDQLNSLLGVLCRFRWYPVAFSCDVERMFHQFHVLPQHRDYLRFLWWPNNDLNAAPVDHRMRVHLFGAASSPGCANFGLKTLAKDNQSISPEAADFIQNDFYVDDGLSSRPDTSTAVELLQGAVEICVKGNLRLHKIASNDSRVMSSFSTTQVVKSSSVEDGLDQSKRSIERALGIRWNLETDTLHFVHETKATQVTKRGVLSTVASIFDPLGLVSPIILRGRQILQEACKEGISWDQELPPSILTRWNEWIHDLRSLSSLQVPRCYFTNAPLPWSGIEFHHFADASSKGYGECSYVKLSDAEGNIHSSLLMAKAKVVPIRAVTIPRLELQAAVLAVKIARFLEKELGHLEAQHYFWTDSRVVLGYIYNQTKKFHVFVSNRLQMIQDFSQPHQWHHVTTKENPADYASRGLCVQDLKNSCWFSGPDFLRQENLQYDPPDVPVEDNDREVRSHFVCAPTKPRDDAEELVKGFSTLEKLIQVVMRIMTWLRLIQKTTTPSRDSVATPLEDRETAFERLVRSVQLIYYPVASRSTHAELKRLAAYTDKEGLLRVGGRLSSSEEDHKIKHPLILPRESHLSLLLTRYHHKKVGHQGRTTTLAALQSRGLWICGARRLVTSVIHRCVPCARLRGRPMEQRMADLPAERIEASPPFTNTGLDCFGPFTVRHGRKEAKRYGLILTCLASRAVHLEVLEDMTTDSFICGLRRFIAIRGNVKTIRCDRGTNFVGAAREFRQARHEMDPDRVVKEMVERNCNFIFNPPHASHFGGVWERLIRTVRQVFSGLLLDHGSRLTSDTLSTLFHEVASVVNNRPLCVTQLEDPTSCEPLTPNHLLTLKPEPIFPPPGTFQKEDQYSRKRWRRVQYLVEQFWTRWKKEYLPTLQPRRKWFHQKDAVQPGMVVLLIEDGAPRGTWRMARVEKTYPGGDGLIRSVQLRVSTSVKTTKGLPKVQTSFIDRPIHKLVPLHLKDTE
ncbi:uncharacterized protein [Littorina saxatilis]|uniref:uncharacterized protein n=1 Tax=Littorina saxatilis TaxID=31220 RepID=UPI0038B45024